MSEACCCACAHAVELKGERNEGLYQCHRYAPRPAVAENPDRHYVAWPTVSDGDECGEFLPAPKGHPNYVEVEPEAR